MPPFRARRPAEDTGEKRFIMTITGPPKGPKPISFEVTARDAKEAGLIVRKLVVIGRLTIEEA